MTKKKIAIAIAAAALAGTCAIGGTLAWLTDAAAKTNTFTVGDVDVSITETTSDYKILPGATIAKDPTITITDDSEDCYLFAYIDNALLIGGTSVAEFNVNTTDPSKDMWEAVDGKDGLYVLVDAEGEPKVVNAEDEDKTFDFFTEVTIDGDTVTVDNIQQLDGKTVKVYAYAHQAENTTYEAAKTAAIAFDFTGVSEN